MSRLAAAFALVLAACPAPTDPVDPANGGGGGTLAQPTLAALEAGVDLDGQAVGPLGSGQDATVAMVFASWCIHCRSEMPVLDELRRRHPDVRVLGVNYRAHEEYDDRGSSSAVREFVTTQAPWLRVVPADDAMWASLGSPPKVPTIYIFDASGALVHAFDRRNEPVPTLAQLEALLPPR